MKKHFLFVPILASLVLVGCGEQPTPPGPDPVVVNPTGITLSASSLSLIEGESETITATVSPDDAADKTVTWSVTQGSDYVTVNGGVITAVKAGQAVVTAKTVNNLATSCLVNVTPAVVDPASVTIDKTSPVIVVGNTEQLTATVLPENATNKSVEWSVIAGNCVSVDEKGLVTGLAVGSAVVQAKTVNGLIAISSFRVVNGVVNPTSVALSDSQVNIVNGDTKQLSAYILPNDATVKSVTWTVSDGDAVTVNESGLVTAVKPGDAVVTASTVNGLTATCSFTVTAAVVDPTGVTLNKHFVDLEFGSSETLTATVSPNDATDKSVKWSVIEGDAVTVINGLVTGVKQGNAKVQVSTINGKTDVCDFTVGARHIKGYVNKDVHSLIVGNPYEKIGEGDFVEVTDKTTESGVPCYNFTYGATVKFNVHTDGYYEPTAIKVNNDSYSVVDNAVTFVAEVEDPDDPIFNILDIEVVFRDNTPLIGDYEIVTSEPAHISLKYTYAVNGQETKACSQGDKIIVTPVATDPDYEVKTIKGYTYTTNDSIQHKSYFDINKVGDGTFYFITPFSHEEIKTIWIEVTEVNASLFKDSDLVGSYAVVRTYGLSESSTYIDKFEDQATITFASSGEVDYKEEIAYASKAENGVIDATFSTSNIEMYYGKNLIVIGKASSTQGMITPLTQNSSDLAIGIRMMDGMLVDNFVFDNFVYKIGDDIFGVFSFYYNNELYASFFADVTNKVIVPDVSVKQYLGDKLASDRTVFEVFDKNNASLTHVGYTADGGKGNYVQISSNKNGWKDDNHSLVFINNETAIYDDFICKVSGDATNVVLKAPTRYVEITLNSIDMTFVVTEEHEVVPKTLDIADKVFTGTTINSQKESFATKIIFGSSNTEITGRFEIKDYSTYFWEFTGEFDPETNYLTITVTETGYNDVRHAYDTSAIGKTRRILLEDGKLSIIDAIPTIQYFMSPNTVLVCDDFHI